MSWLNLEFYSEHPHDSRLAVEGYFFAFVFQNGLVAFVASVAFVGMWLLWLYHALPIYLSI